MRPRFYVLCLLAAGLLAAFIWRWPSRRPGLSQPAGATRGAQDPALPRPNILLISLDTLRPDHLGCYGYGRPTSPNLDRLAKSAVRFSQARTLAPWTTPSHMSLFTSTLPSTHGLDHVPSPTLSPRLPMLAEILQSVGYTNVGIVNAGQVEGDLGFNRGFARYEELDPLKPEGRASSISDRAVKFLDSAPKAPWMLFLHYYDAHDPYDCPEPIRRQFGGFSAAEAHAQIYSHLQPERPFADGNDLLRLEATYDAAIAAQDQELGRVLSRVTDDTLVVVFSDHGEGFKEHGWLWHGATLYEEATRCVLLMRLPAGAGAAQGRAINDPVLLIDVAPTLLGGLGIVAPPTYEGADLRAVLAGHPLERRLLPSETKWGRLEKAVILPPWKLIYDMYTGQQELYKLPDEQHNLMVQEPEMARTLMDPIKSLVARENYWLLTFAGDATYTVDIVAGGEAQLTAPTPINISDEDRATYKLSDDAAGRHHVQLTTRPGRQVESIYVQTLPPGAPLHIDLAVDGKPRPDLVFVGKSETNPPTMPVEVLIGAPGPGLRPGSDRTGPAHDPGTRRVGFAHGGLAAAAEPHRVLHQALSLGGATGEAQPGAPKIDPKRMERLKSLGYL